MRYFTPQLWVAFQGPRSKAAFKIWDSRFAQYQRQLNKILPALKPSARQFFRHPLVLHDGTLIRMEVGDRIDELRGKPRKEIVNRRNLRVRLHVLAETVKQRRIVGHYWCVLEYKTVERLEMNYPGRLKLFPAGLESNLGDWGYDELTCPAKNVFRHEILFSSGATITIDFRGFSFHRKRS